VPLFVSPDLPDEEENPTLQAIRVHLKESVFYFNMVRGELAEMNNSITKRNYLISEKARFDQTLNGAIEAENLIETYQTTDPGQHTDYLGECLYQVNQIKEWAGSSEIFFLRSGRISHFRTLGKPPPHTHTHLCQFSTRRFLPSLGIFFLLRNIKQEHFQKKTWQLWRRRWV